MSKHSSVTIIIFLFFVCLSAIAQEQKTETNSANISTAYRIENGDELEIKSIHNPEVNETVIVRPDGKISLPLANEIVAAGKTPAELADDLAQQYAVEFKQPEVAIIVRTFSGQKVYVGGEVKKPGSIQLAKTLTVLQAISQAEGFTESARITEVVVVRRGSDGKPIPHMVDLKKVMKGTDPKQDILLVPFDIVFVPRSRVANMKSLFDGLRKSVPVPFLW